MDYCTCQFCQWYWLDGYCVWHGRCVNHDHCCDHFVTDEDSVRDFVKNGNEVNENGN